MMAKKNYALFFKNISRAKIGDKFVLGKGDYLFGDIPLLLRKVPEPFRNVPQSFRK